MPNRANQLSRERHDPHEEGFQRDDGGQGHSQERSKEEIERELDKALADSFPSSDPPSISQPGPTEPAGDPKVKP
jgi:hypothetical protein